MSDPANVAPAPFDLCISVGGSLRAGRAVVLTLRLRNDDSLPARVDRLGSYGPWFEHDYDLRGPDGREVRRSRFGDARYCEPAVTASELSLAPHAELVTEVLLSRIFDLTLAGTYTLAVARDLRHPTDGAWVRVSSNVLVFDLGG